MPVTMPEHTAVRHPLLWRLAWFSLFYLVGVGTLGAVALLLRLWLKT